MSGRLHPPPLTPDTWNRQFMTPSHVIFRLFPVSISVIVDRGSSMGPPDPSTTRPVRYPPRGRASRFLEPHGPFKWTRWLPPFGDPRASRPSASRKRDRVRPRLDSTCDPQVPTRQGLYSGDDEGVPLRCGWVGRQSQGRLPGTQWGRRWPNNCLNHPC